MSERTNNTEEYANDDERYKKAIRAYKFLGRKAANEVSRSYGRGIDLRAISSGDFSSALRPSSNYPFHSLVHTLNVPKTSRMIAEALGLPSHLVALAEAAGGAHDVIRRGTIGDDEGESASWFVRCAKKIRAQFGVSHDDITDDHIEMGNLAIYGTIPEVRPGDFMLVGQHVSKMAEEDVFERTQDPETAELIARIVATADLGELFQRTGPLMSHMLLYEINKGKPDYEQLLKFQKTQVEMLESYEFPLGNQTPDFLLRDKQIVIDHSKNLLELLEHGEITTWEEVVTRSCEFARAA